MEGGREEEERMKKKKEESVKSRDFLLLMRVQVSWYALSAWQMAGMYLRSGATIEGFKGVGEVEHVEDFVDRWVVRLQYNAYEIAWSLEMENLWEKKKSINKNHFLYGWKVWFPILISDISTFSKNRSECYSTTTHSERRSEREVQRKEKKERKKRKTCACHVITDESLKSHSQHFEHAYRHRHYWASCCTAVLPEGARSGPRCRRRSFAGSALCSPSQHVISVVHVIVFHYTRARDSYMAHSYTSYTRVIHTWHIHTHCTHTHTPVHTHRTSTRVIAMVHTLSSTWYMQVERSYTRKQHWPGKMMQRRMQTPDPIRMTPTVI